MVVIIIILLVHNTIFITQTNRGYYILQFAGFLLIRMNGTSELRQCQTTQEVSEIEKRILVCASHFECEWGLYKVESVQFDLLLHYFKGIAKSCQQSLTLPGQQRRLLPKYVSVAKGI